MPVWVPAIRGSHRLRVLTKSYSSLLVTVSAFFAMVADTTANQSGCTMNIRLKDKTLLQDIYMKMSVKFIFESVEFVLQRNRFLHLRVDKDVLDWSQLISHAYTQMMNRHVHMQLFSHLRMKLTTSCMMLGNSLIVLRS